MVLFLQCVATLLCKIVAMMLWLFCCKDARHISVIRGTSDFIHTTNCFGLLLNYLEILYLTKPKI